MTEEKPEKLEPIGEKLPPEQDPDSPWWFEEADYLPKKPYIGKCQFCAKDEVLVTDLVNGTSCFPCRPVAQRMPRGKCPVCKQGVNMAQQEKHFDKCAELFQKRHAQRFG